jgi:ABC-type multidrug transport system permease subunit
MALCKYLWLTFDSVLAGPNTLPGFWIFMYRVNPFTYVIEGILGTTLANAPMHCGPSEFVPFEAPNGTTCGAYMSGYMSKAGGYLADSSGSDCRYCAMNETNTFLDGIHVKFRNRWRDFGFMWTYCIFNIAMALAIYWLVRVPKKKKTKKD